VEETLKLIEIVKKTTPFFGKLGKRITKNAEGRHRGTLDDTSMHRLHICCTMRANGSFAIRGNVEFFSCGMRKSDKGTRGYATWFTAGGAIRITHYDVIDDVITRKL